MPKGIARQNIAGRASIARKPIASAFAAQSEQVAAASPQMFTPGSYTFTPTVSGWWKFVLWGGGARPTTGYGGGSGAYCEITKFITTGQTAALVAGRGAASGGAAQNSTVTFLDGTVVTAGAAVNEIGGTATGGDVNLNGSTGGVDGASGQNGGDGLGTGGGAGGLFTPNSGGGAGAPANLPFRGGVGGSAGSSHYGGGTPGGGAVSTTYGSQVPAGDGLIIAMLARS